MITENVCKQSNTDHISIAITTTLHLLKAILIQKGEKLGNSEREEILDTLSQKQSKIHTQMKSDCSSKTLVLHSQSAGSTVLVIEDPYHLQRQRTTQSSQNKSESKVNHLLNCISNRQFSQCKQKLCTALHQIII